MEEIHYSTYKDITVNLAPLFLLFGVLSVVFLLFLLVGSGTLDRLKREHFRLKWLAEVFPTYLNNKNYRLANETLTTKKRRQRNSWILWVIFSILPLCLYVVINYVVATGNFQQYASQYYGVVLDWEDAQALRDGKHVLVRFPGGDILNVRLGKLLGHSDSGSVLYDSTNSTLLRQVHHPADLVIPDIEPAEDD